MRRMFTILAAIVVLCMVALPGAAEPAQRGPDGVRNLDQYDFSARRYVRRYYRPRYYVRPYYYRYYYARPYYYRPYVYLGPPPFPVFPYILW